MKIKTQCTKDETPRFTRHTPAFTLVEMLSVGPDGKEGTDDDIGNWMN